LKNLGATAVFDRNSSASDLAKEIKKLTNEPIKFVYDSISSSTTQQTGIELLAPGGQMTVVGPVSVKADEDKSVFLIMGLSRHPHNVELLETLYHDKIAGFLEKGIIKVRGFSIEVLSQSSPHLTF
jgi:threonine dehydrogenase-like Zn-dependent dehydrogenase